MYSRKSCNFCDFFNYVALADYLLFLFGFLFLLLKRRFDYFTNIFLDLIYISGLKAVSILNRIAKGNLRTLDVGGANLSLSSPKGSRLSILSSIADLHETKRPC